MTPFDSLEKKEGRSIGSAYISAGSSYADLSIQSKSLKILNCSIIKCTKNVEMNLKKKKKNSKCHDKHNNPGDNILFVP